jgi:hypothetical protein
VLKRTSELASCSPASANITEANGDGGVMKGRLVDLSEVVRRAQTGDQDATRTLLNAMQRDRWVVDIIGDLGIQARLAAVELVAKGNTAIDRAIRTKMKELQRELLGPSDSALERLLVDRVLVTWLHANQADMLAARNTNVAVQQAECFERRQGRAQRRHLAALRTLAVVRRLRVPLQINIGAQQVNVVEGEIVTSAAVTGGR